ncbi:MAG TPA: DUF4838 domain-containing protein, partial [Armatimonadota bacterium]
MRQIISFYSIVALLVSAHAAGLTLARDGKALLPIVVNSAGAIPAEKTAAAELATYLHKITGAPFSTIEQSEWQGGGAIYVGDTAFARAHGVDPGTLGPEESVIRAVDGSLILSGGRPRGVIYAIYRFLERQLGVRWYTPWAEKVPMQQTLTLPELNERTKPYFEYRLNNAAGGCGPWLAGVTLPPTIPAPGQMDGIYWLARNRQNVGLKYITTWGPGGKWIENPVEVGGQVIVRHPANHSFAYFIPDDVYFKDHPEYFSLYHGKRVKQSQESGLRQLCLSNPELPAVFATNVEKWLKENPDAYYVSITPNDGAQMFCECDACRALAQKYMPAGTAKDASGCEAGLLLQFINKVAAIITKDYPNVNIFTLSYNYTRTPPVNIQADPHVIVQICGGGFTTATYINPNVVMPPKEQARIEGWSKVCQRLWVWDYQCGLVPAIDNLKPMMWAMDRTFKYTRALGGFTGIFIEAEGNCPPTPVDCIELNTWLSLKLMEDPTADAEALIKDFCLGYYGKAGPYILQLLALKKSRLTDYPLRMVDWPFMRDAQALMEKAVTAVQDDPTLLPRVLTARINLDLAALQYRQQIHTDYLAHGNPAEKYPFTMPVLKARVLASVEKSTDYFWYQIGVQQWKGSGSFNIYTQPRPPLREQLKEYLDVICQGPETATPLPPELAKIPRERIIDLVWPQLLGNIIGALYRDPDAALGMAFMIKTDQPFFA